MNTPAPLNPRGIAFNEAMAMRQNLRTVTGLSKGNVTVTPEQHRKVLEAVVIAARQQMVARELLGGDIEFYNDIGVQTISYDTLTEMSGAQIDFKFTENEDQVDLARTNVPVPLIHKEFEIDFRDLASSQRYGTPLSTLNAEAAAYQVAITEDATLIQGWTRDGTDYDVDGFYQAAGNTDSTSADFAIPGKPITAVAAALAMLEADKIKPPYNMALHPTQYNQLMGSIYTGGVDEVLKVTNMLKSGRVDQGGGAGGLILATTDIVAGTGMIVAAPGRGFFKYHVPMDVSTKLSILEKSDNLWGRVYVAGRLVVNDKNCICTMTAI